MIVVPVVFFLIWVVDYALFKSRGKLAAAK
jgi:hypothetical protein